MKINIEFGGKNYFTYGSQNGWSPSVLKCEDFGKLGQKRKFHIASVSPPSPENQVLPSSWNVHFLLSNSKEKPLYKGNCLPI